MYRQHEDTPGWDRSKANRLYKALKKLIVDFKVPPDTRLDPRLISVTLKTSVTPLREALIQIETEKYIVGSPRNGYYTRKLDTKQLSDEYGVANAILQGVFRQGPDEHSKLWSTLPTIPSSNDCILFGEFLEVFYEKIAEGGNNGKMLDLVHEFNIRTRYVRLLDLQRPERLSCIISDMRQLVELLDKQDKNGVIANIGRQFSAIIENVPELVLEGNLRAGDTKESWLKTLLSNFDES
ncbi:transcriptional regulator [Mesorhizobium australicum WSM2073]|uniref:Transcriptional regulator n=3 Tax=Mesorhizobium TaxID=68287 RepID=L0KTZ1_MESAW|nr:MULTISPECIES: GntR family transcriptional regulator [Mesorhizobium]ADV14903.1 regulatory protein GntR HTH [Mesorhizobium ciceri biovar biserrulae WSM1271]AEH90790.1 transcriptional regulator, GntR family [Mesorhizobium opportunistum WSM2075]AGB48160.1 transcriptional regulator [Mesorhizobium australicum WSM2073]OBP84738.1 GntR family transcriptional regulator [Mesorhizobium loti]